MIHENKDIHFTHGHTDKNKNFQFSYANSNEYQDHHSVLSGQDETLSSENVI